MIGHTTSVGQSVDTGVLTWTHHSHSSWCPQVQSSCACRCPEAMARRLERQHAEEVLAYSSTPWTAPRATAPLAVPAARQAVPAPLLALPTTPAAGLHWPVQPQVAAPVNPDMVTHLSARVDGLEHTMRDLLAAHQGIRQQLPQLELRVAETDVRRQLAELTAHMEQVQIEAMERINALHVNQGATASAEPQGAEATAEPQGWTWSYDDGRWQPQQEQHH